MFLGFYPSQAQGPLTLQSLSSLVGKTHKYQPLSFSLPIPLWSVIPVWISVCSPPSHPSLWPGLFPSCKAHDLFLFKLCLCPSYLPQGGFFSPCSCELFSISPQVNFWSVSVRSGICRVASLGTKELVGTIFAPLPLIWIKYHLLRVAHSQTGCLAYLLQIPCPVALENLLFWSNWHQSQCSETLPQKTSKSLNLEV